MRKISQWLMVSLIVATVGTVTVSADSFGFYFGDDGFGVNVNIGDYDYYDRHSPGFYESGGMNFQAALSPYGSWYFEADLGGQIWIPSVPRNWRPYSQGSWSYTQYGWTWVAYEPWGWIPHHYGNWIHHHYYGWAWVPGYTWSPANVTWGIFNGYYGWAPLPPRHCNYYRQRNHYTSHSHHWYSHNNYYRNPFTVREQNTYSHYDNNYYRSIPNEAWVMVDNRNFTSGNIAEVAVSPSRVPAIFAKARFEVVERAPEKQMIERHCGKSIQRTRVDEVVKNINGHQVKVVRPVNVLKTNSRHVKNVKKNFKPTINRKPAKTIQSGNTHHGVKKPAPTRQINKPAPTRQIKRPAPTKQIKRPAPTKQIKRPAPKPQIKHPAPTRQIKRPAPKPQI
ncbi:hypothetical protein K8T06_07480, partial [bacterium]|nr:hypothetical protein [bacterium]